MIVNLINKLVREKLLASAIAVSAVLTGASAAHAANITAGIGAVAGGSGSNSVFMFVGADDGNVWLNTDYGAPLHWQNLVPLNVSFGAGVLAPGGQAAAYAVATDGNLYIIHIVGSSYVATSIGTPAGVALTAWNGTISNTSNQRGRHDSRFKAR
jgi:hypothetical protein